MADLCVPRFVRFRVSLPINDSAGHSAGDALLQNVAAILSSCIRGRDSVARIGGDEFAVLLEDCPIDRAELIADEMCKKVSHRSRLTSRFGVLLQRPSFSANRRDTDGRPHPEKRTPMAGVDIKNPRRGGDKKLSFILVEA